MINFANLLSLTRVIVSPVIIFCLLINSSYFAFYIFLFAILTDMLDGFVARLFNCETKLGALLDPLADKALTLPLILYFALQHKINLLIVVLYGLSDISISFYRLYKSSRHTKRVLKASSYGKLKTIIVSSLLAKILLINANYSTFSQSNLHLLINNFILVLALIVSTYDKLHLLNFLFVKILAKDKSSKHKLF